MNYSLYALVIHHVSLIIASPSSPMNLNFSLNDRSVRLQWDPPLDNGGVPITGYPIFINSSEDVLVSNDTEATIVLNSTGKYFIQIRAINCIGVGSDLSVSIHITGTYNTLTIAYM